MRQIHPILLAAAALGCDPGDRAQRAPGPADGARRDPVELVADGAASTPLRLTLRDADGALAPDGTAPSLSTDLGTIRRVGVSRGGRLDAVFTAGTWPGTATVTAAGWSVGGDRRVQLVEGTPTSVQLHLHGPLSEGAGTMAGHSSEAERLGIDRLWWTEHDFGLGGDPIFDLTGYDFESGSLSAELQGWPSRLPFHADWRTLASSLDEWSVEVSPEAAQSGRYGLRLHGVAQAGAAWTSARLRLDVNPRLNFRGLLGQLRVGVALRPITDADDQELWLSFPLSATQAGNRGQLSDHETVHLVVSRAHDYAGRSDATTLYVDLDAAADEWTSLEADLSALVEAHFGVELLDRHAEVVTVLVRGRKGATFTWDLDDLWWSMGTTGLDLKRAQQSFADSLPYDVQHLVGHEISFLHEGHLNAFGEDVDLLPWSSTDRWTAEAAVQDVHDQGGIVSFNHVFGTPGGVEDAEKRSALVDRAIEELSAARVYGADLLEVGYPSRVGRITDFTAVWDALSIQGIWVTGIGTGDMHDRAPWDEMANNFVTWVPTDRGDAEDLMDNLARGAVWFGRPSAFDGADATMSLQAADARATMGQVVVGHGAPIALQLAASPLLAGWTVRLVTDGSDADTWTVGSDGAWSGEATVDPVGGLVARFEVLDDSGTIVLLSNPIHFVDRDDGSIPAERLPAP